MNPSVTPPPVRLRVHITRALATLCLAVLAGAPAAASAQSSEQPLPASALIVQLRTAETALAASGARAVHEPRSSEARLNQVLIENGLVFRATRQLGDDWQLLDVGRPLTRGDARALAARLRGDPRVAAVALNQREQRQLTPNDTLYAQQWWLKDVAAGRTGVPGLPSAWNTSTGNPVRGALGVVAVLDSGITSHPELNARLLPGYDFVADADYSNDGNGRDNDPADPGDALPLAVKDASPDLYSGCNAQERSSWHGTLIAGQLAAVSNEAAGVAGINWSGRVVPVRVAGRCGAAVADIIDGMRWAAGLAVVGVPTNPNPARVLTLSYGGIDPCDADNADLDIADTAKLYLQAIDEVRRAGVLVVAAAGNERRAVGRPASCAGAFAVAALNQQGFKSKYSNFGPQIDLATVGGDADTGATCDAQLADTGIVSTANQGALSAGAAGYAAGSGSSFAAPSVAGVATLMLALRPELTLAQLEAGLKASARPHVEVERLGNCSATLNTRCTCTTASCGAGMLDAAEALRYAQDPASYAAPVRAAVSLDSAAIDACATLLGIPDPSPPEPPASSPDSGGGGGGGGMGGGWLLALLAAVVALQFIRRGDPA